MSVAGSILEHLGRSFAEHADRVAIESWPDGRTMTYAQLDRASAALAGRLSDRGVAPGSKVPIILPRSLDFLVAVVATLRCGAAYAPIDPTAPRRDAMLEPLNPAVVIGHEAGMLNPAATHSGGAAPVATVEPHAPAYVMYTSGTTGVPKGVVVPHRAIVRLVVDADYARFGPEHRWGAMSAVAFDASTLEIWGALLHGGCCVVQSMPVPGLDDLATYFEAGRVSDTWLTASLFNALVDEHPRSMANMGQLLTGGERESMPHIRKFRQLCPSVSIIHGYGPTENTTFSLCHTITENDASGDRIPIGTPISGSTMRIVKPGAPPHAPREPLTEGELLVGGLGLALGYLGDDQRTAEKFVLDPQGERWYRTGDLVRLRGDGAAVFVGRVDRQVKIRGHRIEPDGVEAELAACRGVEQATVVVVGDTAETRRLIAFFVPAGSSSVADVRDQLAERLPPAMMPERFAAVEKMPIGPTGKVDRGALLDQLDQAGADVGAPASDTEAKLIELFKARLGRDIGRNERFQDAGGHSLLAMRLSADAHRQLGLALPAAEILRRQTVASIAQHVESRYRAGERQATGKPACPPDAVGDIRRRTSLEHERDQTGRAMLVHHAWHVSPAIPIDRLREAWTTLLQRHDALRTRVRFTDASAHLVEHDPRTSDVFHAEHEHLGAPNTGDPIVQITTRRTFTADEPPARMHVWPVADGSQIVLLTFHHAAIDEWSLELIASELDALLKPGYRGEQLPDPEPYSTFVAAEHQMLDAALAEDLVQRISQGPAGHTPLPEAGPQAGTCVYLAEDALKAAALDERAADLGVGPAALLAAGLSSALQEIYGPPARWLMTPFARRGSEPLQRVVGCCLDMRVLEAAGRDMDEMAKHLHEQMLEAQGDSVLPLETVIEEIRKIAPERAADATRFGMTYRHIDDRPRALGPSTAQHLGVEQSAARFGLCLHVERRPSCVRMWLEADASHFSSDRLRALGQRVVALVKNQASPAAGSIAGMPQPAGELPDAVTTQERHELAEIWNELLGQTPDPGSDFFIDGGTSLLAMRMSAAIHRRLGRRLMLNQFLRRPTFTGLTQSIQDDYEQPYAEFSSQRGAASDQPWCVAIPGSAGRAIDYHRLWTLLGERAPDTVAFDLATIAAGESGRFNPDRFYARFTALTHAHALRHDLSGPITLMGYSLGGLIALDMATSLKDLGHTIRRVVLLDAYAPAYLAHTPAWLLGKLNAQVRTILSRSPRATASQSTAVRTKRTMASVPRGRMDRWVWRAIHADLARWRPRPVDVPVVLLRCTSASKRLRPIRHGRTNGLGPLLRAGVEVREVDIDHLAMLTTQAATVAATIQDLLMDEARAPESHVSPTQPNARRLG